MLIRDNLPQFDKEPVLILVLSLHELRLLKAYAGEIEEIHREEVELPEPADKEGHFESRTGGKTIRSGAVYEHNDSETVRRFKSLLKQVLPKILQTENFSHLYVFIPSQIKNQLDDILSKEILEKIILVKEGNHMKDKPFDLLEMINEKMQDKKVVPTDDEAEKILRRGQ